MTPEVLRSMLLETLAAHPHGRRIVDIAQAFGVTAPRVAWVAYALEDEHLACKRRVAMGVLWTAEEHRDTLSDYAAAESKQRRSEKKRRNRESPRSAARRKTESAKPARYAWPQDAYSAPTPLVRSVWDLPAAMGVA